SCVFVVINIVRDNPSFFVAYFLFTQEFILNQKIKENIKMDERVKDVQVWLNQTYGKVSGFKKAPLNWLANNL
uniref:hypothetical protein n=2 Tax=Lactobacillus delbrueckii TaxID=1584 RepID=UPI0021A472F9